MPAHLLSIHSPVQIFQCVVSFFKSPVLILDRISGGGAAVPCDDLHHRRTHQLPQNTTRVHTQLTHFRGLGQGMTVNDKKKYELDIGGDDDVWWVGADPKV